MRLQFATIVPIGTASLKNNRNPARMRIPAATAVVAASPAVGAISRASESKRSVATGIVLGDALERGAVGEQATLKANGMSMQTTLKQKHSIPPGARGLILFWILSFPMALAAMVYALGML